MLFDRYFFCMLREILSRAELRVLASCCQFLASRALCDTYVVDPTWLMTLDRTPIRLV